MIMNYYYINVILKMMILIIGRTLFKKIQDVYLSRFCYNNTTTIEEKFLFLKKKKLHFFSTLLSTLNILTILHFH